MPRRGKQAAAAAAEGESSTSVEPAAPEAPAELDPPAEPSTPAAETLDTPASESQGPQEPQEPQALQTVKPVPLPTVVLHKKFGKYRCLFNNEDSFNRRYDVGSDSETNSSVEIRVVDPCASSESDSNAAIDTQSDTTSGVVNFKSLNNLTIARNHINNSNMSPVVMLNTLPITSEVPITNEKESTKELPVMNDLPEVSEIPLPSEPSLISEVPLPCGTPRICEIPLPSEIPLPTGILNASDIPLPTEPILSEIPFQAEVPLVSEIPFPSEPSLGSIPFPSDTSYPQLQMTAEINLPMGIPLLNDIPMPPEQPSTNVSPEKYSCTVTADPVVLNTEIGEKRLDQTVEERNLVNKENVNPVITAEPEQMEYAGDDEELITIVQIVEDDHQDLYYNMNLDSPNDENREQRVEKKEQDSEFQKHFENLNINTSVGNSVSMDCSEPGIKAQVSDHQLSKESTGDVLGRPDPSLTPSSTLSDDSNSSRAAEPAINFSNESAESSPTGVRRSSRIKTISSQKQKSKGYGLVKTPLKKALITQTKLKLEEHSSDSQEKSGEATVNNGPNSPSFPVPSDLPVKVKSRWRRSSELEMGANSPANSPLASPSLPQRLQPVPEALNPDVDQAVLALSKEAYDKIIDERMRQFQHLDENEYLCERMISKDTKKMICDCFMTKEEIERGELGCGEDCLNRLLMIEWYSKEFIYFIYMCFV